MELLIPAIILIVVLFLTRAFGAWMLRIDEVVEQLKYLNKKVDKLTKDKKDSE
tara:strand:- start:1504 stop:1662 length:159 start_codon:yes stop_codon:yes gene_type:complete